MPSFVLEADFFIAFKSIILFFYFLSSVGIFVEPFFILKQIAFGLPGLHFIDREVSAFLNMQSKS